MDEHREPSIDPQPGELGDGRVDVPGGTELAGGRDTGGPAGGGTAGTDPGGYSGLGTAPGEDDAEDEG